MKVAVFCSEENAYSEMLNQTPTVDQLTDDAAVVLGFMLRSASDPSHTRLKRQWSDNEFSHSFQSAPAFPTKLDAQELSDSESDNGDECDAVFPPSGISSAVSAASQFLKLSFTSNHDMPDKGAEFRDDSKLFHERTNAEKDVILENVADELRRLADGFDAERARPNVVRSEIDSNTRRNNSANVNPSTPVFKSSSEKDEVDSVKNEALSPAEQLSNIVHNREDYSEFEQAIQEKIGEEVDWHTVAQMFRLTQVAIQHAGMGSTAADQIQAFTLRYFRQRFAPWIAKQGGWRPVINSRSRQPDEDSQVD